MVIQSIDDDPIRNFDQNEEKILSKNLFQISKNVKLFDCKQEIYSIELLRKWHLLLFRDIRDHAGRFRNRDYGEPIVTFGPHRSTHRDRVSLELESHIRTANRYINELDDIEARESRILLAEKTICFSLILHAKFIKIHPFRDGNGRIGRMIITYIMSKYDFPPIAFEKPKAEYIKCLNHYYESNEQDLEPLYSLALNIFENQL